MQFPIVLERGFYDSTYFDASPCVASFHHAYRGNYISRVEDVRGTYYVVIDTDYQSTIEEKQLTVDYDTNYSLATLIHSSHMMNPSPSTLALIEASESKSGLAMTEVDVAKYTFDGETKPMHYVNDTRKFPLNRNNTIMYDIVDAMFMSVYQQHFDDIVVQ